MGDIRYLSGRSGLILLAFLVCGNVRPSSAQILNSDSLNLIANPSFEVNGQPTLQFWTADTFLTAFVQDTPPGGGSWSLMLGPGWIPAEGYARTYVSGLSGRRILELTVWIKSLNSWPGSASLGQWSKGGWVTSKRVYCDSTNWTQISIDDTLSLLPTDTVAIHLSAGATEVAYGEDLFDLVRLMAIPLTVSVQESSRTYPVSFSLEQNYPNPFNPSTTIRYGLSHASMVQMSVYNTLGQKVAQLVNGEQEVGLHELRFDGGGLASGVYFYRIQAGSFVETKKLELVR